MLVLGCSPKRDSVLYLLPDLVFSRWKIKLDIKGILLWAIISYLVILDSCHWLCTVLELFAPREAPCQTKYLTVICFRKLLVDFFVLLELARFIASVGKRSASVFWISEYKPSMYPYAMGEFVNKNMGLICKKHFTLELLDHFWRGPWSSQWTFQGSGWCTQLYSLLFCLYCISSRWYQGSSRGLFPT